MELLWKHNKQERMSTKGFLIYFSVCCSSMSVSVPLPKLIQPRTHIITHITPRGCFILRNIHLSPSCHKSLVIGTSIDWIGQYFTVQNPLKSLNNDFHVYSGFLSKLKGIFNNDILLEFLNLHTVCSECLPATKTGQQCSQQLH